MNKNCNSIKKRFITFLKANNAFEKYMRNVKIEKVRLKSFLDCELNAPYFLGGCFIWQDTKEGHFFWENLNEKWKKILGAL